MGIAETFTVYFVIMKLLGKIDWSWWLVLLPEIIAICFYAVLAVMDIHSRISLNRAISDFVDREVNKNG